MRTANSSRKQLKRIRVNNMKRILGILLLAFCASAHASIDGYDGNGLSFPDEKSPAGLPEAIPCTLKKAYTGQTILNCTWLANARAIPIWDANRRMDINYNNQVSGMCQRGKCRVNGVIVGQYNGDIPFLLSLWYQIGVSTDGKPVAYHRDATRGVSYAEAGSILWQFYQDAGIPDNELVSTFDKRYEGGWAAWNAAKGSVKKTSLLPANTVQSYPVVKSAWCNPRADDDCYIDNKKVLIADLGKYLPSVSESNIDQLGGYCETILCFDESDQPLGYLLQ